MRSSLKILLIITAIITITISSHAQSGYTTVTATVVDSNGTKFANAPYTVTFFDPGTSGKLPLLSGSTFQKSYNGYATDGNGNLSISLPDNGVIASTSGATGTQWVFNICTAVGAYTTQFCIRNTFITISGASQNISAALTAAAPLLPLSPTVTLQTNSVNNTVQSTLNLKNGSNTTITSDGSGGVTINSTGGGGATTPGAPVNCFQYNLANVFTGAPGICTPDGNQLSIKGNSPWSDITAFGARAFNGPATTTANFTSGNTTITVGAGQFINNDGLTIQGAGPAITMTTPSAPTVTPQYAAAPTRDHIMVNSPTGGSNYTYCVVAEDRKQGLTPCSTTTVIATGTATLGKQTVNISTESLSNDTLTVNTASGTFVNGMMVDVLSGVPRFTGPMRTTTGAAGTFTVGQYVYDSRVGPVNTADVPNSTSTAGTVVFYQANTISWPMVTGARRFWICAQRPGDGSLHVIGQSDMSYSSTGWRAVQFEDYGSSYLSGQSFPYYITDSICTGSGQADSLTTTVVSGGGTTSIVVANAPSSTDNTNTKKAIYDSAPNILAAANQAANGQGCIYIPPQASVLNTFLVQSLLSLPAGICIIQSGGLNLEDTLELSNVYWLGLNNAGVPQFGYTRGAASLVTTGNPAVHLVGGGDVLSNLFFVSSVNGSTAIDVDNAFTILNTVDCGLNSPSDTLGICVRYRNTTSTIQSSKIMGGSSFISGIPQSNDASWTAIIDIPQGQDGSGNPANNGAKLDIQDFSGSHRSISNVGAILNLTHYYIQGPITPTVYFVSTGGGNTQMNFTDVLEDTSGEPILADLGGSANVIFHSNINGSATNPIISGTRPNTFLSDGYFYSGLANPSARWAQNCAVNSMSSGVYESSGVAIGQQSCYYGSLLAMLGGYPIYWPLSAPATPTLAGPNAGGSMPSGTFEYAISATGFDGGETIPSPIPSATITTGGGCPGAGNCTVTVNWVAVTGAKSYNIWRCASSCTGGGLPFLGGSNWLEVGLHQTGTSFNDTINAPTNNNFAQVTGTGISQQDALEVIAPQHVSAETTAPSCVPLFDQIFGILSTHRYSFCNNGGAVDQIVGAATTDILTNKSYDTAGAGNVFKINGNQISAISGNTNKAQLESGATTTGDALKFDANGNDIDAGFPGSLVICAGLYALDTNAIANNARDVKSYNTCSLSGSAANINHLTDHATCDFSGDPNAVTGYAVSAPFITLRIYIPAADGAFDIDQINQTGGSVTPGAQNVVCSVTRP